MNRQLTGALVREILSCPKSREVLAIQQGRARPRSIVQRIHFIYDPGAARDFSKYERSSEAELYRKRLKFAREAGMVCNGPKGRKATKAKRQPRLIVDAEQASP